MRLVSFRDSGGVAVGALVDDGNTVVDLSRVEPGLGKDMLSLLWGGAEALDLAQKAVAGAAGEARRPLSTVKLLAPVPRPGKIIGVGLNYRDHATESGAELPQTPTIFAKFSTAVIGPNDPIVVPSVTEQVDYEGELGVVIGRRTRDVSVSGALQAVAGYVAFNDVSARDYQARVSQWTLAKSFDTFAPMGPALVTRDEVPDPQSLDLRVTIGEELLQHASTASMVFSVADLVAFLSSVMTLEPGDVIATGTPSGVGAARKPPRWLRAGDVVEVELSGIGKLSNPVVASADTAASGTVSGATPQGITT